MNSSLPKISIIIPSYNKGKYIGKSIESVINQNYPNTELIIIDAGSNDNTASIINENMKHISCFISETDKGQSDAMNKGLKIATGDLVSFLNADDWYELDTFNRVAKEYDQTINHQMIIGNTAFVGEDEEVIFINHPETKLYKIQQLWRYQMPNNPVAYFYSPSIHHTIGYYPINDHYSMDYDFLLKSYRVTHKVYIDKVFGYFRYIKGSKTFDNDKLKMWENIKNLSYKYAKEINSIYLVTVKISFNYNRLFKSILEKQYTNCTIFEKLIKKISAKFYKGIDLILSKSEPFI